MNERLLAQHRIFRQHPVEIGAEPVCQIVGLDRPSKPARVKATGDSIANLDPRDTLPDRSHFTSTVGKRYHTKLGRAATAAFEDHQIAVI